MIRKKEKSRQMLRRRPVNEPALTGGHRRREEAMKSLSMPSAARGN
jgi:hypothetical protein